MPFSNAEACGVAGAPASTGALTGFAAPASGAGDVVGLAEGELFGRPKVFGASNPAPQAASRKGSARQRRWCRSIERAPLLDVTWCVGVGIDVDASRDR